MNIAYVGGAADERTRVFKDEYIREKWKNRPHVNVEYFSLGDSKALARWIDEHNRPSIIGHIYGADTIAKVVADGHKVENLVTVDHVSLMRPDYEAVKKNAGNWVNYNSTGGGWALSNITAQVGRKWGHSVEKAGVNSIDIDADHAAIVSNWRVRECVASSFSSC